ncbi:MAG: RDD family protein [Candidatus Competibacteraceae bacterium]|nr:RDD family protein [Candidatus Competibacteraceae bacterium]
MKRTADTPIEAVKAAPGLSFNGEVDLDLASKIAALEAQEQKTKLICPACGAVSTELRLSCQDCGNYFDGHSGAADVRLAALSSTGGLSREEQEKLAQKSYLTRRFFAKVIDSVILLSLVTCQYLIFFAVARSLTVIPSMAFLALNFFFWGMPCLTLLTLLGYHAIFEASQVQASPGKIVVRALCGRFEQPDRAFGSDSLQESRSLFATGRSPWCLCLLLSCTSAIRA